MSYPILEFDDSRQAIIEPSDLHKPIDIAECCIVCFFQDVITGLREEGRLKVVYETGSEIGVNPVYELDHGGFRVALFHPGVGASLAAAFLEEVIALGCRKFIAIGSAGVLDNTIHLGKLVVPTAAIRDEGTSYHYLPPAREVSPSPAAVTAILDVFREKGIDHLTGKTWTTDGVFRETPEKIKRRREEGCVTVEMEAAAFYAVAQFRKVTFGQILYGGDDVSGEVWDSRHWISRRDVRLGMFDLALEAVIRI